MSWFKGSLNDQVKALSSDIANAYVERAQLCFQFLSMKPPLVVNELAALWAVMAEQISKHEDRTERSDADLSNDLVEALPRLTRVSFDSFCQSFVENVLKSDVKLNLESQEIRALVGQTFDAMGQERAQQLGQLIASVASNATQLASATMLLQGRLKKEEVSAALKHAVARVRQRSELNQFEKAMAEEWLTASASSWSNS